MIFYQKKTLVEEGRHLAAVSDVAHFNEMTDGVVDRISLYRKFWKQGNYFATYSHEISQRTRQTQRQEEEYSNKHVTLGRHPFVFPYQEDHRNDYVES